MIIHMALDMTYTGCTQCATHKLSKKVLHIGYIVAQKGQYSEKISMQVLIKNRHFLLIMKNKGQFRLYKDGCFGYNLFIFANFRVKNLPDQV